MRLLNTIQFVRVGVRDYQDMAHTCGCVLCVVLRLDEYSGADNSLARHTSRCILFDGENISFDASLIIYIYK